MPLFAYEIEFRRRRVAIQTGLFQRRIEHFVSSVLNRAAVRGDLQSKKLPAVAVWKGRAIMLYHCLCRDQLQNCARRIFLIGHAVLKYSDGFPELFGIGILNPGVSYFRQVEEAAEALFGYRKIISRKAYGQIETQNESDYGAHYFSISCPETGQESLPLWRVIQDLALRWAKRTLSLFGFQAVRSAAPLLTGIAHAPNHPSAVVRYKQRAIGCDSDSDRSAPSNSGAGESSEEILIDARSSALL